MNALLSIALIFLCAIALMALEAFIPGVSLAGIAAAALFGFAAYLCWQAYGAVWAVLLLLAGGGLSVLIMRAVFRSMKSGKLSQTGIFLDNQVSPAVKAPAYEGRIAPGSVGVAQTALRPAGIAQFDQQRIHVISASGFIEKDEKVTVEHLEGAKVIVRLTEK